MDAAGASLELRPPPATLGPLAAICLGEREGRKGNGASLPPPPKAGPGVSEALTPRVDRHLLLGTVALVQVGWRDAGPRGLCWGGPLKAEALK